MVRAVVFDLYETLITESDPAPGGGRGQGRWRSPADRLGVTREAFDRVWRARKDERMTSAVDFRDVLREASARDSREDVVADVIEGLYQERLEAKAARLVDVEPPILDALTRLDQAGLKLGLVSNCSIEEVAAWDDSPLSSLIDKPVFSYAVGHAKPDETIYHLACARLGVRPNEAAFVGDGGSDELAGAVRSGLRAYAARWFVERWPDWRRSRDDTSNFAQLKTPADLLKAFG